MLVLHLQKPAANLSSLVDSNKRKRESESDATLPDQDHGEDDDMKSDPNCKEQEKKKKADDEDEEDNQLLFPPKKKKVRSTSPSLKNATTHEGRMQYLWKQTAAPFCKIFTSGLTGVAMRIRASLQHPRNTHLTMEKLRIMCSYKMNSKYYHPSRTSHLSFLWEAIQEQEWDTKFNMHCAIYLLIDRKKKTFRLNPLIHDLYTIFQAKFLTAVASKFGDNDVISAAMWKKYYRAKLPRARSSQLNRYAEAGFDLVHAPRDGYCLFSAAKVADPKAALSNCLDAMESDLPYYAQFAHGDLKKHIGLYRENPKTEWTSEAGEAVIWALSAILNQPFRVFHPMAAEGPLLIAAKGVDPAIAPIFVAYNGRGRFCLHAHPRAIFISRCCRCRCVQTTTMA
jgi:hypothetical protein